MVPLQATAFVFAVSLSFAAQAQAQTAPAPAAPTPLAAEDLDRISGGQEVTASVLSNQQLTATNTGNTVSAGTIRSGDVTFSDSALSNFAGVGNFVVNTGANNNLQGSISVNIISMPATR